MLTRQTTRVSTDSQGAQANAGSEKPGISANGRLVVFRPGASNLVAGDTNGKWDEFVKDSQTGAVTNLSPNGNGESGWPAISVDGVWVTYPSHASNLVPGDTNSQRDIFLANTSTGQMTRVSTDSAGVQGNGFCGAPQISANGRHVAFMSGSNNLISGDTNATWDIFRKDTQSNQTVRYSTASDGAQSNRSSDYPAISASGAHVTFVSQASNLVADDTNGTWDVFLASAS